MKATDLMIKDWVHVPQLVDPVENYNGDMQIKQLRMADLDCYSFKELRYDEIEPIPLTPEILEKNGFEYIDDEYAAWYLDGHFELRVREPYCGKEEFEYCNIILNYVHELQHIMKLCKINKEIKL